MMDLSVLVESVGVMLYVRAFFSFRFFYFATINTWNSYIVFV